MANPYSNLSKISKNIYNSTNKAADGYYNQTSKALSNTQKQTEKELNQKKVQADKAAMTEGKAAQSNYMRSINPYGAGAESQAINGLAGSGFSESSKISAYNSAQNRIANARSTAEQAKVDYDNQIAQSRNTRDTQLAEAALNKLNIKSDNANNYVNQRISVAGGDADWRINSANYKLSKKQLDLQKKELKFNMDQAKKANVSSSRGGKSSKSSSSSKKSNSSGSSKKSSGNSSKNKVKI
ncbi:hypothetical protein [Anaerofustis stercorihominis]|uniref:Uncharacterized protein n=1 Tax=Anaerofustis stercorihominis TaxID=214853 RepID=A0A3E3DXF4_9FIRM|nr:hypothetical protein [Anaerofustis stercorihominis]RGD73815.1 hypothetical protein DW687_08545 [Anaerofustis stercorihominis]